MSKTHRGQEGSILSTTGFWLLLIVIYFNFQVVYRSMIGAGLGLDEAQAFLGAQSLHWGYGQQPPLYFWLQWAVFQVFGANIFSLALLKFFLLAVTFLSVFFLLRRPFGNRIAGLAMLSLVFIPQIIWESHRALTHSVLATTLAVISVLFFWRLLNRATIANYVIFGIVLGVGLLTKATYLLIPIALILAGLFDTTHRQVILNPRMFIPVCIAGLIIFLPMTWALANYDLVAPDKNEFWVQLDLNVVAAGFNGLGKLSLAAVMFLLPSFVLALTVLPQRLQAQVHPTQEQSEFLKYMARVFGFIIIMLVALVLTFQVTLIKERWLQAVLIMAPPLVFTWLSPVISNLWIRIYLGLCCLVLVAVLLALPIHFLRGDSKKMPTQGAPWAQITEQINSQLPKTFVLVSTDITLLANIKYLQPNWPVTITSLDQVKDPQTPIILIAQDVLPQLGSIQATDLRAPYKYRQPQEYIRVLYRLKMGPTGTWMALE